ncbi:MAG TPA: class I SAM-dependent methyltransferase [Candidatus Dormibacteraeota bacterium]
MELGITGRIGAIDWAERWRAIVSQRSGSARPDPTYWDRRAPSFARSTGHRKDDLLSVIEPYLSPRKTLIDAGAGAGRHAVPLAERLEWVTAVEPSEGMRAQIPPRDNMTVIASTWQDAEVAKADLVICCHVLYGIEEAVPFIAKLQASAGERVFIMLREGPMPHPATPLRERLTGEPELPMPRFSDLFMLLIQMGIAPDVTFVRYPVVNRYADMEEALNDCRMLIGSDWDETRARTLLEEMLTRDGDELVFDGGVALSGIAHWQPRES